MTKATITEAATTQHAALRPYLHYAAPKALPPVDRRGSVAAWCCLEKPAADCRRTHRNSRTTCSTTPTLPLQPPGRLGRRSGGVWPSVGRPPKDDLSTWIVTDDWPRPLPVTEAEIDVFEAWFGDLFDELFGPCQ